MGREELRFKSFSERVLSIRVDVAHRSRRRPVGRLPDDETHFKEVLEKWVELNCTQDFAQLVDLIGPDVDTVAQLILAKDGIFKLLLHQLSQKDCRCLEPNLELVVALARDLQQDFYPQFASFFEVITSTHLQERSAEVIEQVFTCLADLFQFQWRFMVEDIERVFELYQPLLSENHKDYIKAFAAESFAFLMRKVKDKPALLNLVFNRADEDESFSRGFGVLLFEMLKGVKTRLHSCSEEVFPLILRRLAYKGESTEARLTIVRTMLEMLCNHVASENTAFVWNTLKDALLTSQPLSASYFAALCQCYGEVVSFKNGKLILDPDDVCHTIEEAFKHCPEDAFPHFLDTFAVVLSTCEARGASEESLLAVIDALVASEQKTHEDALADMLERLSKLLCFRRCVVPRFWKYCEKLEVKLALHLLTRLESLAATKILCGSDLVHWKSLERLENLSESPLLPTIKKGLRLTRHTSKNNHDLERFWESCVLVRHLRGFDFEDFAIPELRNALKLLLALPLDEIAELTLVCVQECVRSLVAFREKVDPRELLPILKSFKKPTVLRSMDLALHSVGRVKKTAFKQELLEELWWQLASPHAVMRFLTLRILSHFEPPEAEIPKGKIAVCRYMLNLESVAVTVQEFKNRANLMEKLGFETVLKCSIEPNMCRCTLAFLFGQLYINFSQLWPTVKKLIATYSEYEKFWQIFEQHLEATTNVILGVTILDDDIVDELLDNATLREVVNVRETYENTDYELHRVFLWNIVELIENSAVVSAVPRRYFLELYEKEFRPRSEFIFSENVVRNVEEAEAAMEVDEPMEEASNSVKIDDEGAIIIDEDSEDEGGELDREDSINDEPPKKKIKAAKYGAIAGQPKKRLGSTRNPKKCLGAALSALLKSDLRRIPDRDRGVLETCFTDLLMLPDATLQRLALECLFACGKKILLGHKENLMKLLDDKEWMGILNDCFLANRPGDSVDGNSKNDVSVSEAKKPRGTPQSLSEKERKKILPFVMRLLFGRMRTKKTGHGSKSRVVSKHAAVLRFLASSRESDLLYFIELILLPLKRFMAADLETKPTAEVLQAITFDPESAMPVKRLRLVLSDVAHVLKHMAGVLPNFLPLLLRAVLVVLQYSNIVDDKATEVNRFYLESIKRIRMRCVDIVHVYFRDLDHYAMDIEDIHLFFDAYVWPSLLEFNKISTAATARVYRLVSCFASKERLQFLLALRNRRNITRTIMSELMMILESPSTDEKISKQIKNTVRLLLSDVEPGNRAVPIAHDVEEVEVSDVPGASLGLRIVLPYTFILLSKTFTQIEKTKKPLDPLDRFILYKLSEYNSDPTLASHMLQVIVPSFFNSKKSQERGEDRNQFETLAIIKNIIAHADSVEKVYPSICRLWSSVTDRSGRNVLIEIFETLSTRVSGVNQAICEIVKSVNSWDPRLAEEPDYLRRIKGFRELVNLIETMKVPEVNSALPLIHNCLYTSLGSDDLSLRDASTFALTKIITFCHDLLGEGHEAFFRTCVEQEIYTGIKRGLKNVKETTRHESVKLLAHVLSTCDDRKLFEELKSFQDPEKEKDFFECIIHIQIHRRARALNRLSQMLSKRSVSHRVVRDIFLPLTESFLLKEEYSKQNIAEAAIENLGALAKKLPWRTYARLLEKYIDLLGNKELCAIKTHQKLVVKIVVTLLEAFHFDLSQLVTMFEENMTSLSYGKMSLKDKMALPTPDVPISLDTEVDLDDEGDEQLSTLPMEQTSDLPPDGTITVVDVKVGREILVTLKDLLLKRLQTAIVRKSYYSQENDEDNEENDVLRVPIAVAIVKLLSLLPSKVFLRKNLPSVLLKVIVFLKSRLLPVRETARAALVKIIQILGPCYLKYLIREMRALLTRGFQLHVLSYTVHAVLEAARPQMQNGDLDECVEDLLEICMQEQFGIVSEQKDVAGITAKTDEAKKSKSVDMFRIVAAVVSDEQLQTVLDTVERKLLSGNNAKIVTKCEKVLDAIGQGLETNKGLSKARVLIFCYKLLNENTTRLLVTDPVLAEELEVENERNSETIEEKKLPYEKPDVFLVPKAPTRGASTAVVSVRANVHVLIGTALKVLRDLLRKNRGAEMSKMLDMLNPFVEPLCKLQRCSYVNVVTEVMVVLQQLLHYPLPAFGENLQVIVKTSMNIIHKYLGTTQKAGNNYQMLIAAFKTVRCVLEEVRDVEFTEEQYKMLLTYVESDICDVERQIVAFALLGSIIGKGINLPELHSLMKKVADMSIQEPVTAIRNQARTVYQKYLFDYPIEPKLREKCVSFYLGQLEYAVEDGRRSAAEMVYQIIKLYPEPILIRQNLLFFVPLAASLVNDSSVTMKKMTYACLTSLLNKLDVNTRTSLYSLTKKWLQDVSKIQKQCLGAQVIGCFADVEKENFASRVDDCLGIIVQYLAPREPEDEAEVDQKEEHLNDRLLYLLLNSLVKIMTHVNVFESPRRAELVRRIMNHCRAYILHPHSWVRTASAQIFGLLFAQYQPKSIADSLGEDLNWLSAGGRELLDELVLNFLEQFESRQVPLDLLNQLTKNLLFVAKVLLYLEISDLSNSGSDPSNAEKGHRTFSWFVYKIERELRDLGNERTPNLEKRTCLYKVLAALSLECPRDVLHHYHQNFLGPVVRDLESRNQNTDTGFNQLVKEVSQVLRKQMGFDFYQEKYASQLTDRARLKARMKQRRAVERMLDPDLDLEHREKKRKAEKANKKLKRRKVAPVNTS